MSPEEEGRAFGGNENREFLEGLDARAKAPELVNRFIQDEYGKPAAMNMRDQETGEWESQNIGVILPRNKDNTGHFILFNNGDMLVTKPRNESEYSIEQYRNEFSPSDVPLLRTAKTVGEYVESMRDQQLAEITHTNSSKDDLPKLFESMDEAIKTAQETKVEREEVKRDSMKRFNEEAYKHLFRPEDQDKPPSNEPPQPPSHE